MWEPAGVPIDPAQLGGLGPTEVLYEHEGEPLTFVAHDPDGQPLLAHNLCASERTSRYLVAAVERRIVADLKCGRIDLRSALGQPRCWVADVADDAAVRAAWGVAFDAVPEAFLPGPGVMLNAELADLRLIGPGDRVVLVNTASPEKYLPTTRDLLDGGF